MAWRSEMHTTATGRPNLDSFFTEVAPTFREICGWNSNDLRVWSIIHTETMREFSTFEEVERILSLRVETYKDGIVWMSDDRPVAFMSNKFRSLRAIYGDIHWFGDRGFVTKCVETTHCGGTITTCEGEIIHENLLLSNLREEGWYPSHNNGNYIIWATGVRLGIRKGQWWVINDPIQGTEQRKKGTRVFDNSKDRLARLRQFFAQICPGVRNPRALYLEWAQARDLYFLNDFKTGKGPMFHFKFEGWTLDKFGPTIKCNWKQRRKGPASFYGVIK